MPNYQPQPNDAYYYREVFVTAISDKIVKIELKVPPDSKTFNRSSLEREIEDDSRFRIDEDTGHIAVLGLEDVYWSVNDIFDAEKIWFSHYESSWSSAEKGPVVARPADKATGWLLIHQDYVPSSMREPPKFPKYL